MARIEIGKYLVTDSRVYRGRLIFKGTRIAVGDVLQLAAAGFSPEMIAKEYRNVLRPAAVREALSLTRRGLVKEVSSPRNPAASCFITSGALKTTRY